ncbi:type I toxin-antitoxin system Ibs family toxin [Escherichia coli]|nr:type I toxin-antitoxin system Ibs family toxin [Escherichia coli]MBV2255763.1 type I toxin-antitoxin system Ibs family toxin [Escherichia coli]
MMKLLIIVVLLVISYPAC